MILLSILIFSILFQAKYDAVNGNLHDLRSKLILCMKALCLSIIGIVLFHNPYTIIIYALLRISIFDISFSYFRYGVFSYIGITSDWDLFIKNIPPIILWTNRLVCGIFATYLILKT